jgi:hypothetical protein
MRLHLVRQSDDVRVAVRAGDQFHARTVCRPVAWSPFCPGAVRT